MHVTMNAPKKLCLDLCCGLGGFSRAFRDNPDWEVVTVDIERKFKPTIQADVRFLPFKKGIAIHAFLASPPCERFSYAPQNWPMKGIKIALEIVGAIFEFIAEAKPRYWIVENPRGYLVNLMNIKPYAIINQKDYGSRFKKPTALWTNIMLPLVHSIRDADAYVSVPKKKEDKGYERIYNKAKRAEMPYGLSQAILEAVSQ